MSEAANDDCVGGFSVRQDGRQVEERGTYSEALAIAQEIKRAAPEMLVTVWDLAAGKADIIIEP